MAGQQSLANSSRELCLRSVRASSDQARRGGKSAVTGCLDRMAAAAQAPGDDLATLLRRLRLTRPETWLVSKAAVTSIMIRACRIAVGLAVAQQRYPPPIRR